LTKGKVPSKASYKKTGEGEKPDDEKLNEIENAIVNIIVPTTILGHEGVMEADVTMYFQNINESKSDEPAAVTEINLPLEDHE